MTWEDAWREGRTRWDAGQSPPVLLSLVEEGAFSGERALVTGCGAGHDVFTLAKAGFVTLGLDLAPTAEKRFHELREEQDLPREQADILLADFFAFVPKHPFDVVWDYTFLCAIEPERRPDWAAKMNQVVAPYGELVTLLFPVDIDDPTPSVAEDDGPPYRLHPEVARSLLASYFSLVSLVEVTESHRGREGKEWLARWRRR